MKIFAVICMLFLSGISYAQSNCEFSFDEVRRTPEPETNFMVVWKRDENGVPEFFKQLLPMNLEARDNLQAAVDDKKGICIKATRFENLFYVYEVTKL